MNNFDFKNPAQVVFGKDIYKQLPDLIKKYGGSKVLLHMGGGSIKANGIYDEVKSALDNSDLEVTELWGVKPNPHLSLVLEGIEICKEKDIDFVLALGGGSVIDSAKAIAAGVALGGDVWEFFEGKRPVDKSLPIGAILTIPAAGSETSASCVITNKEINIKCSFNSGEVIPKFALMNPEVCYSLPNYQTACGAVDIIAHMLERYFTPTKDVYFTDRLIEGGVETVMHFAPKAIAEPKNYDYRAQIMWAGSIAHNNLLSTGRDGDWSSHSIGHQLSANYDMAHGETLAIIIPAWMKYVYKTDVNRFSQLATRVFGIAPNLMNTEQVALDGIEAFEKFITELGLCTRLSQAGINDKFFDTMSINALKGNDTLGMFVKLTAKDVEEIYKLAL